MKANYTQRMRGFERYAACLTIDPRATRDHDRLSTEMVSIACGIQPEGPKDQAN